MKSKNELKETDLVFSYSDDKTNSKKINFSNVLLNKKLYNNISVYKILYTAGPKPLRIRFDKIDGYIIPLNGKLKHLILFDYGLYNKICDKIKCLINNKVVLQSINHNLERSEFVHIIHYYLLRKY